MKTKNKIKQVRTQDLKKGDSIRLTVTASTGAIGQYHYTTIIRIENGIYTSDIKLIYSDNFSNPIVGYENDLFDILEIKNEKPIYALD